jgi:hypothetical protein
MRLIIQRWSSRRGVEVISLCNNFINARQGGLHTYNILPMWLSDKLIFFSAFECPFAFSHVSFA